ncbi:MAG: cell division protein ZapA [bacterium]|nr:cell division protein ZapA [bacterium]
MKKDVEISLLNQKLTVRTEAEPEHVSRVARFVNEEIGKVEKGDKKVSSLNLALLACMNIADEYLCFKESHQGDVQKVEQKIKGLIEMIGA